MRIPPNHSLVVKRSSTSDKREEPLQTVLRKAFDSAHRQLKQVVHKANPRLKEIMTGLGWEDRHTTKSAEVDVWWR